MKQLSGLDASFLYAENEKVANHIGGLYIYDQSTVPGGKRQREYAYRTGVNVIM